MRLFQLTFTMPHDTIWIIIFILDSSFSFLSLIFIWDFCWTWKSRSVENKLQRTYLTFQTHLLDSNTFQKVDDFGLSFADVDLCLKQCRARLWSNLRLCKINHRKTHCLKNALNSLIFHYYKWKEKGLLARKLLLFWCSITYF